MLALESIAHPQAAQNSNHVTSSLTQAVPFVLPEKFLAMARDPEKHFVVKSSGNRGRRGTCCQCNWKDAGRRRSWRMLKQTRHALKWQLQLKMRQMNGPSSAQEKRARREKTTLSTLEPDLGQSHQKQWARPRRRTKAGPMPPPRAGAGAESGESRPTSSSSSPNAEA